MAKKNANGWDDPEIRKRRIAAIRAALAKRQGASATKKTKKASKSSLKAKASKPAKKAKKASPKPAAPTQAKQQPDAKLAKALHTLESRVKVTPINSLPATA